jgi:hypothetical protein
MWWLKSILLILIALFVDLFGMFLSFLCIAMLGTLGGGAVAYAACSNVGAGQTISQGCAAIGALFGTFANAVTMPLGIALGYGLTVCISAMGLALLSVPLAQMDMFYPRYLLVSAGKIIPLLDIFPFLSGFVVACVMAKNAETKKGGLLGSAAKLVVAVAAPEAEIGTIIGTTLQVAQTRMPRADIRPPQRNYESAAA